MQDKHVALVTGANQGLGFQAAKHLVAHGFTVLVGSRDFERGGAVLTRYNEAGLLRTEKPCLLDAVLL